MSVSWAVTDNTSKNRPALARHETFHGYFTDIQRVARRSLPKRPSHELRELLGLKLVPAARTKLPSTPASSVQEGSFGTIYKPDPTPAPVAANQSETITPKQSASEKLRSLVQCSEPNECSWREKTICGCNLYFAIVIFLLLIIVIILASTISTLTRQNAESSDQGSQVSIINPTIPPTVADTSTILHKITSALTSPTTSQYQSTFAATSTVSSTQSSTSPASITEQSSTVSAVTTVSRKSSSTSISTSASLTDTSTVISTSTGITDASSVSVYTDVTSSYTQTLSTLSSSVAPKTTKSSLISSLSTASSSSSKSDLSSLRTTSSTGTTSFLSKITATASAQSTVDNTLLTDSSADTSTASSTEPTSSSSTGSSTPAIIPILEKPNITCSTNKCNSAKSTAARGDFSISPCQDFFQFSCGAWEAEKLADWRKGTIKNVPLTVQDELRQTLLLQIRDILQEAYSDAEAVGPRVSRRLYQACIESNVNKDTALALQQLHSLVDWLGVRQDLRINNNVNNILYSANSAFQVTPFLKMSTVATLDNNDVNVYALQIEPPTLYLGSDGYQEPYDSNTRAKRYVQVSTEILYSYLTSFPFIGQPVRRKRSRRRYKRQLGINNPTASFGQTSLMVLRSYNIEQTFWQIVNATTLPDNGLPTEVNLVRLTVLKSRYPNIPWESAIGLSNNNALIKIVNPSYFEGLNTLLPTLDKADLMMQTFLTILLQRIWPYMPWPFRRMLQEFGHNDDLFYSEIDCVEHALTLAREEIHALYIGRYTRQVLNNRFTISNMIHVTKGYYQQLLSFAEWIQPDLERVMTGLMNNMKSHFSSVKSKVRESSAFTGANQTFLSLAVALHAQLYEGDILKIGSNVTEEIEMDWTKSTVFYDPYFNMLGLPTGMTVYLADNEPGFSRYGSIQTLLSIAFIEILSQGEMEGELTLSWWGPQNIQEFVTVLNCFGTQLSPLQISNNEIGSLIRLNGVAELTKQIFEGISRTSASYINGTTITENMLFYMNIAQVYCRADTGTFSLQHQLLKQRINNAMMNHGDFEATFSCPSSSRLVTSDTCSLFK